MKVKILGAGSIGNHLSNASRRLGWSVDLVDNDPAALERTRSSIYPGRYGAWDLEIQTFASDKAPKGGYDLIFIGTPPDSHMALARAAIAEKPRAILVEKPLCGPSLKGAQELADEAKAAGVAVFVGYDHVVGKATRLVSDYLSGQKLGALQTLDVEFREYWGGIFAAHPWLAGPWESYLGFWQRGGGASGEHSHAANLWQHFAHSAGAGRVVEVQASLDFVRDGRVDYDRLCLMNLKTEKGLVGRCVQDVVTQPPRKWARAQGSDGHVEWWCGCEPGVDAVVASLPGKVASEHKVSKTRPDDFIEELTHIDAALAGAPDASPLALSRGLDTMLVVAAAHRSAETGRRVVIDYSKGWRPSALSLE
ncbi:Gfo/Idh/MocA family oxidoreductase [Hyphomicrobium sp.]|uniref:Gfo/Idh/MocA family protein n=1 Tax=Hyphomicrobium sp. TaxID=82 RepID=UPI0025B89915|nr:Gfo/Idh/MocA family oxidoreductase [Hyphomicrobium sp.]MCC7250943.1 Gfo/Idh/MocA family oxidoreductase [Hyphomicrobium sp.]